MIFPPRPENAILPSLIQSFENRGWVAQLKKNGTCSVASVSPDGAVDFKTRHGENHKAWTPTEEAIRFFAGFPDSIFIFELLHSKGGNVRDTIYIFDVIRYLGRDLTGTTFMDRHNILKNIHPISPRISMAGIYTVHLNDVYVGLSSVLDEGIVLKDPNGVLRSCSRDSLNSSWQVKCRKATKNYGF